MSNLFDFGNFATGISDVLNGDVDIFSFVLSYILIVFWLVIIFWFVDCLSRCFIFRKANKNVWAAFIPIYSKYVECEVCGVNTMWVWINLILSVVFGGIPLLGIVSLVADIYVKAIIAIRMSKSFGKDSLFGFFTFIFRPICYFILGCGSSQYIGPQQMDDPVLQMFGIETNLNSTSDNYEVNNNVGYNNEVKYCSSCGNPVNSSENYCAYCGNKI